MRQARTVISTYSADVFGVCSALYELGGMIVMHDASGCNSTYSTHDEPRWYKSDAMVFISGLTEMEAIMGDDEKFINDIVTAIEDLKPLFTAIAGTPIPMMTGCDMDAIARTIEKRSGVPCLGFQTSGMRSYLCGVSEALESVAHRFVSDPPKDYKPGKRVNILGATPLDFSINGTIESLKGALREAGFEVISSWAMTSSLEDLKRAGEADVNLVIAASGLKTARYFKERFATPYLIGAPAGPAFTQELIGGLEDLISGEPCRQILADDSDAFDGSFMILGEPVLGRSIASAIYRETGQLPCVINSLEDLPELAGILSRQDLHAMEEEEIAEALAGARIVIADPMFEPIAPRESRFISLPHEAFSGRLARKEIPDFVNLNISNFSRRN